ncbi:unnamed protein product [Cylicocyclus nassatus]|uniref:Uncharacterized protein n=1 Tax=Cylicocyclus nassatus TaxID=53992 RepID=A0AA36HGT9_CYLNA|nr:unnamed protein product [Cylicocyclus nassatus]
MRMREREQKSGPDPFHWDEAGAKAFHGRAVLSRYGRAHGRETNGRSGAYTWACWTRL